MKALSIIVSSLFLLFIVDLHAQKSIDFDSDQWQIVNGEIMEHLGRQSFKGTGFLKGISLQNGTIEVDVAVDGGRSYPGINFRIQSQKDYERFYIRPHRQSLYPDALQYTPCINGISEWQLCSGEGYTSGAVLPRNEWIRIRLEIKGEKARVFINDQPEPALRIHQLKHGISEGSIGLNGPANGTAYFSNLRYHETEDIEIDPGPVADPPVGMVSDWEISQAYQSTEVDYSKTPEQQGLSGVDWQKVKAAPDGLVNIGRYRSRLGNVPDLIFARTELIAEKDTLMEYRYGYSDAIMIFLNGKPVAFGNSAYQQRDPSFLGIIGLNDAIFLPLKKGKNELLLVVIESFGGWGFMFQQGNTTYFEEGISKVWETDNVFKTSESVLYDPKRKVIYVTNFDQFSMGKPEVDQSISKVNLNGEILELDWVTGLNNPLGITIHDDKLYVSERKAVAIVDLDKGEIVDRIPLPASLFLNDIAVDKDGVIYISDSRKDVIWKVTDGTAIEWLSHPEVADPNVLYMHNGKLLIGNSEDHWLKSVDLATKKIKHIARFPNGFIDGIRVDNSGSLLVSLWRGKIYRVNASGEIELIFHTQETGQFSADFEYIPKQRLLLIPTFFDNKVVAYKTNW